MLQNPYAVYLQVQIPHILETGLFHNYIHLLPIALGLNLPKVVPTFYLLYLLRFEFEFCYSSGFRFFRMDLLCKLEDNFERFVRFKTISIPQSLFHHVVCLANWKTTLTDLAECFILKCKFMVLKGIIMTYVTYLMVKLKFVSYLICNFTA